MFENYISDLTHSDGRRVELALWDTAGQEDYDRLRPLSYPDSDVILVAFGIDSQESLGNVYEKWVAEVHHFCPDVTKLLVGLKKDLRGDEVCVRRLAVEGKRCNTVVEGEEAARVLDAECYLECSSKTGEGVKGVFEEASRRAMFPRKKGYGRSGKGRGCVLL